jgi:16S rRNA (cytosine967-C5)-methyltransferase
MTPGARVQAAIDLLAAVDSAERPAERAISGWLRRRRFIGAHDRRAISELVFRVLRHGAALEWWLRRALEGEPEAGVVDGGAAGRAGPAFSSRRRVIALLALSGEADAARMATLFDGGRYAPAPLEAPEEALARNLAGRALDHPDQPVSVRANYPAWLDPALRLRFGDRLEEEMAALNDPAPIDLRVNVLKASREEARAALAADGLEAEPTPLSPLGLRLSRRQPLGGHACFVDGLVDVQDEGAQIVSLIADARPGMRVVDYCAGAGGKTLALAAAMGNRGEIAAVDASTRLDRAAPRLARAGVTIVTTHVIEGDDDPWLADHADWADRVLVDAPCAGLGAWRRDPAARWRLGRSDLERLVALQRRILDNAGRLVRPGGRLVYATCSLLGAENEDQVAAYLDSRAGFRPIPVAEVWGGTVGGRCPCPGPYLELTPARHGTDGFFAAVLERSP